MGWNPKVGKERNVRSAISFLERKFPVNYDQRHSGDVENLFNMSSNNHHMISLAHSPSPVGLFFSILNQFTSTAAFVSGGQLITIKTETFELQGGNFIAKLFCGIANWFGHLMSDIAGSSGGRGDANAGRGSGIVVPFYELFRFCNFGSFEIKQKNGKIVRQDLATIATRAFQEGYDFRFGMAMAIPVILTDLSIRLIWSLRQYFQYEKPLKECIPTQKHADLRMMLIFGNGTLCVMDAVDAGIRSVDALTFFARLNFIAWFRLVTLVLKEVCIRIDIRNPLEECIDAFKQLNEALLEYLHELEKIDIQAFKRETEQYNELVDMLTTASTPKEWNTLLLETYKKMDMQLPWSGDFNEHMADKNATLRFS